MYNSCMHFMGSNKAEDNPLIAFEVNNPFNVSYFKRDMEVDKVLNASFKTELLYSKKGFFK